MFIHRKLTRRRMLEGFSAAVAAAPFLGRIRSVHAQSQPVRFVALMTPNDTGHKKHWGAGLVPGGALPEKLPFYLEGLSAFRNKMVIVGDLQIPYSAGGTHEKWGIALVGSNGVKTGDQWYAGGPSLDHIIAARHNQRPLVLGYVYPGKLPNRGFASWSGPRTPNVAINNPRRAFEQIFGSVAGGNPDSQTQAQKRRSVLDYAAKELTAAQARLPAADRSVLQAHLDGIRDLERQIAEVAAPRAGCSSSTPAGVDGWDPTRNENFPRMCRLSTEVAVQAMRCDLRRSITLQYGAASSEHLKGTWPEEGINNPDNLHTIAHDLYYKGLQVRMPLERFLTRLVFEALKKMDAVSEGARTLLDNSVVLWTRGMGIGHKQEERFSMILGGAGGKLRQGRYFSFNGRTDNDLLLTCAHLAGFTDIKSVGDASGTKGTLPGVL
jgi:hypothetical protein